MAKIIDIFTREELTQVEDDEFIIISIEDGSFMFEHNFATNLECSDFMKDALIDLIDICLREEE